MKNFRSNTLYVLLIATLAVFGIVATLSAGTTGKLVGNVTDANSGDKLLGANILIEGTQLGGSADADGYYLVLTVTPGVYTLRCSMMGYETMRKTEIEVVADRTTTINFKLKQTAIQGQEVVVRGERAIVPMDVTSTEMVVTPEKIANSAFRTVQDVLGSQAGIQAFGALSDKPQIRGSDMNESSVVMDGLLVVDNFSNRPVYKVNLNAVQEVKVITGGFNAEYGNVRSGVINIVTKEGGARYSGSAQFQYNPAGKKHFGPSMYGFDNPLVAPFISSAPGFLDGVGQPFPTLWKGWNNYANTTLKAGNPHFQKPYECYALWLWRHRSQDHIDELKRLVAEGKISADLSRVTDDDAIFEYANKPDYNGEFTLGGPVPFTNNRVSFFATNRFETQQYQAAVPRHYSGQYSTLKLTGKLSNTMKLTANLLYNSDIGMVGDRNSGGRGNTEMIVTNSFALNRVGDVYSSFDDINKFYYPNIGTPRRYDTYTGGLTFNHVLSAKTFYEINFQAMYRTQQDIRNYRNTAPYYSDQLGQKDLNSLVNGVIGSDAQIAQWSDPTRVGSTFPAGTTYKTGYENWNNWAKLKIGDYWYDEAPWGYDPVPWRDEINYYRLGSGWALFDSTMLHSYQMRAAITSQVNKTNQIKAGFDVTHDRFHQKYILTDYGSGLVEKHYTPYVFPWKGAVYIQDKLEFQGLIANLGLRWDWQYRDKMATLSGPASDKVGGPYTAYVRNGKGDSLLLVSSIMKNHFLQYLSPRIGISHPISDKAKIFFNYAHMIEWPNFNDLYNLYHTARSSGGNNYINTIGNPELTPPRTITYEVGYAHNILNMIELKATGYYKDINGEADFVTYRYVGGSFSYTMLQPMRYRDIRGVEITADMRYGRFVSGTASFNYMVTSSGNFGYNRFEEDPSVQPGNVTQSITQPFAQPYFRTVVDLHTPANFGPRVAGAFPLEGMNLNVIFNWREGDKFTWNPLGIPNVLDNIKWRSYKRFDLRFTKRLPRVAGIEPVFFMDVVNVFNFKNMTHPTGYTYSTLADGSRGPITGSGSSLAWSQSGAHYWWANEFLTYMNSLDLKENTDGSISGPDRPGDYPANWPNQAVEGGKQSYIKMPGYTSYTFLEARDIFFGIRINF